eukprot:720527-Amphidinium_carterae.2
MPALGAVRIHCGMVNANATTSRELKAACAVACQPIPKRYARWRELHLCLTPAPGCDAQLCDGGALLPRAMLIAYKRVLLRFRTVVPAIFPQNLHSKITTSEIQCPIPRAWWQGLQLELRFTLSGNDLLPGAKTVSCDANIYASNGIDYHTLNPGNGDGIDVSSLQTSSVSGTFSF